ncbi:hypothetical protein NA57DRAFT_75987 [Rhizodiscina lignyota]|uniref:DNA2/NAM7 helicase-like C-terminal domain-containing protein n=1 Tax=Rhizodiscina lignyota TaxID=1504668 RepID=A0A9P4IGH3_9PEZI|nr:hypothetical protein NA57DRAFT_75987 [Rhizodiscina lignyota]
MGLNYFKTKSPARSFLQLLSVHRTFTPYRRQAAIHTKAIQTLAKHCHQLHKPAYSVVHSTVDSFIGNEVEIGIVDIPRTQSLGFNKVNARFNLAVTRARSGLIIIGNFGTLQSVANDYKGTFVAKMIQYLKEKKQRVYHHVDKYPALQEIDPNFSPSRTTPLKSNTDVQETDAHTEAGPTGRGWDAPANNDGC